MAADDKKLQKLRTFNQDLRKVQGGNVVAETKPTEPAVKTIPSKPLPPVFNQHKPAIIPPTAKPAVKTPPTDEIRPAIPQGEVILTDTKPLQTLPKSPTNIIDEKGSHKISAEIATIKPHPQVFQSDDLDLMEVDNSLQEGNIITDQKRERFKLLPAMGEAINMWFQEGKQSIENRVEKRRQAIPTVQRVEDRKDIVKKAAEKSFIAPKDDYAKLTKKIPSNIKTETNKKPEPALTITKRTEMPAPSWSHYEGEKEIKQEEKNEGVPAVAASNTTAETAKVNPLIPPAPVKEPEPPKVIFVGKKPNLPKPEPEPQTILTPKTQTTESTVNAKPATTRKFAPPRPTTRKANWLFYAGATTIAVVAIIGGGSSVWWLMGNISTESTNPISPTATPLVQEVLVLREDNRRNIPLSTNRERWYSDITSQTGSGLTASIPTITANGVEKIANAEEVLSMLDWEIQSSLARAIEGITFFIYNGKPVITLEVSSFDAAFGGLLLSESAVSQNLAPLFGDTVVSSYEVGVGEVEARFIDGISLNHDVRILKDETDRERIVYGFVEQNIVIITTDRDAFAAMSARVR